MQRLQRHHAQRTLLQRSDSLRRRARRRQRRDSRNPRQHSRPSTRRRGTRRTVTDMVELRGWRSFPEELPVFTPETAPADPQALFVEWLARLALARPIAALAAYVPKRERGDGASPGSVVPH